MNASFLNGMTMDQLSWMNACKAGALLLAAHMLHIGLWAYTAPCTLCEAFGLRFDGAPSGAALNAHSNNASIQSGTVSREGYGGVQLENFWPILFAPREIAFGLMIIAMAAIGEWKSVGVVVGTIAGLLATTDGVVACMYGSRGWRDAVKSHGFPGAVLGVMAVVLLGGYVRLG